MAGDDETRPAVKQLRKLLNTKLKVRPGQIKKRRYHLDD